jgi:hypothetical protein
LLKQLFVAHLFAIAYVGDYDVGIGFSRRLKTHTILYFASGLIDQELANTLGGDIHLAIAATHYANAKT